MSDFAVELYKLRQLSGADFIAQLKVVTARSEFHPLVNEPEIFTAGGERREDYPNLINAASKAVTQGYRVFILPSPKGIRMADFILVRKGVYKLFELKSISGKSSANNRLMESIGQTNHVMLNMLTDYDARQLAIDVKGYFEANHEAREVIIVKGNKFLSVSRSFVEGKNFVKMFMKRYLR